MTITDAWIVVGIFIIIFEVLYLFLHCIFSTKYDRDIQRIDEFRKKSEAELQFEKELEEKQKMSTIWKESQHWR